MDKEAIIKLWSEVFGDSVEEITFFIDNVKNAKCLMLFDKGKAASMMYLVDCKITDKSYSYIYAACTLPEYRDRGFMTELIDFCFQQGLDVCLIPASDSLIDYYAKRGISHKTAIDSIIFEQIPEIKEYLFEGYNLTVPTALRS